MAFVQTGQFGPEALIDGAGNALTGAVVTVPSSYVANVDVYGNLTVTGPPSDSVAITVAALGTVRALTIRVLPKVSELSSSGDDAVGLATATGRSAAIALALGG